jgi:hypothetical protein
MLRMVRVDDHVYEGAPEHEGSAEELRRNVVFGGQILAQMIMAADLDRSDDRANTKESSRSMRSSPGGRLRNRSSTRSIACTTGARWGATR